MNNQPTRKTIHVSVPVAAAAGVLVGVAAYSAGFKSGFQLKKLVTDLQAHQIIVMRLRESAPELLDSTVKTVVEQAEGVYNAANNL